MIKNIIFDFGGVIMTIDHPEAVRRFTAIGLKDADHWLDPYTQGGIFGAVEQGLITDEEFRVELSKLIGRELTWEECQWAWLGYRKEVPARCIAALKMLRKKGYRLIMLSNTNPYMMAWAMSPEFSRGLDPECPEGAPTSDFFDSDYRSYQLKVMKPDTRFFEHVIKTEDINPDESLFVDDGAKNIAAAETLGLHTFSPKNGEDWTDTLLNILDKLNA